MRALAMVLATGLAAGACGCSLARSTPAIRYYVLAVREPAVRDVPAPLRVGTVTADHAYASARLAVRTSPYALDYQVYARWAAPPRVLVANALRDAFEGGDGAGEAIVVDGDIRRFEAVEQDGEPARGEVVVALRAQRDGAVLLERTYEATRPAAARDAEAYAAAISGALDEVLARFVADVARALRAS